MKEYDVTITETLQRTVTVEAESQQEAEDLVHDAWNGQEYVLDAEDFIGVEFQTTDERERQESSLHVLLVEPGAYPRAAAIGTDLKSLQEAVGGPIEIIYPFADTVGVVLNEEGKLQGLPLNRAARTEDGDIYDIYAGTFLIAGLGDEELISLTPEQMQHYEALFHQPEIFLHMGQGILVQPMPEDMVQKAADKAEQKSAPQKGRPER